MQPVNSSPNAAEQPLEEPSEGSGPINYEEAYLPNASAAQTLEESQAAGLPPLPPDWEARVTPGGRVYYLDHKQRKTTWNHPLDPTPRAENQPVFLEGLPKGWEALKRGDDKIYFVDHNTKTTTYDDPREKKV